MYRNKKIILFGAMDKVGSVCNYVVNWMNENKYEIMYLVDNDHSKHSKEIHGKEIKNPNELLKENREEILVVITSGYLKEISNQLKKMGFERGKNFIGLYDWDKLKDDYILYKIKKSVNMDEQGYYLPKNINLELASACNMECCYCPYHSKWIDKQTKPKKIFMTEEIFNNIVVELSKINSLKGITIGGRGEFLLHPKWYEYVQSIRNNTSISNITLLTNGKLLNEENCVKISGLNFEKIEILISIDGYSEEENTTFRINSDYNIIKENLNRLISMTKNNSNIEINIMNVKVPNKKQIINESELDIPEYIKNDFVGVGHWGSYAISFYDEIAKKFIEQGYEIVEGINENLFVCDLLFKQIAINSEGKVVACACGNGQNKVMEDIASGQLLKLWNGKEFNEMRELFFKGKNPQLCNQCQNNIELKPYKIICRG